MPDRVPRKEFVVMQTFYDDIVLFSAQFDCMHQDSDLRLFRHVLHVYNSQKKSADVPQMHIAPEHSLQAGCLHRSGI